MPTAHPQRLIADAPRAVFSPAHPKPPAASIQEMYAAYAGALALNPWLEFIGCELGPVSILPDPPEAHDPHGHAVALQGADPYALLAHAGGQPMHLFGEWNGRAFRPLTVLPGVLLPGAAEAGK